jgi:hypothetical protein
MKQHTQNQLLYFGHLHWHLPQGENTLQGGQVVVTLYFFLRVPCLNFNHVIIIKDFHNVLAYYDNSKKSNVK